MVAADIILRKRNTVDRAEQGAILIISENRRHSMTLYELPMYEHVLEVTLKKED